MHVNDTFGQSMAKGVARAAAQDVACRSSSLDTIPYDPAAKDLTVEVSKAKATNAELLLLVCRLNDAIVLRREMVKQRWSPMGVVSPGSPGLYEEQFAKGLGKYADDCITNTVWFNPKNEITRAFAAAFKKRFPKDEFAFHGINASYTFDALLIAADAFKRAKSTDPKALADAIRQTEHPRDRSSHVRRADQVQREGPGRGQPLGRDPEPPRQADGRAARASLSEGKLVFPMPKVRVIHRRVARVPRCQLCRTSRTPSFRASSPGPVYGLMALGLSAIFGVIRLVNFAHGELMTLAMYAAVAAFQGLALDPFLTMIAAAAVFGAFGYVLQRGFINRFIRRPEHTQMLLMIALAMILGNALLLGVRARRAQRPDRATSSTRSSSGRCCSTRRASTPRAPRVRGRRRCWPRSFASPSPARRSAPAPTIRSARASSACRRSTSTPSPSALGAASVAVAGCAMVPLIDVTPGLGPAYTLLAFVIVIVGGLGSMVGALLGRRA